MNKRKVKKMETLEDSETIEEDVLKKINIENDDTKIEKREKKSARRFWG